MTRDEIIKEIVIIEENEYYTRKTIKEEALNELEDLAEQEGCEWGEQVPYIIQMYRSLQPDYCSEEFAKAVYEEIINLYVHMVEYTEVVEYPEESKTVTIPAKKVREWTW